MISRQLDRFPTLTYRREPRISHSCRWPGLQVKVAASWLLVLQSMLPGPSPATMAQPQTPGTIDIDTANRLVEEYARQVLARLPREWRQQEEQRWRDDPPRLDPPGVYQINGPAGRIAFEYDPEGMRLLCNALVFKPRRDYPLVGLTQDEILEGLRRAAASGIDTGGGELLYDQVAKGFFLRRTYSQPPKSIRRMTTELDRLTAAGERWARKHYLDAVLHHADSLRPPASATAEDGDLEVTIVLTPDVRYHHLWHRPPGAIQPQLVSRSDYKQGQEVWAMALFSGATPSEDGLVRLQGQYSFVYPGGKEAGSEVFVFWDGPPPPENHLQMVEPRAAIELGPEKEPGAYLARVKVCDVATQRCVTAITPFRVLAGSE